MPPGGQIKIECQQGITLSSFQKQNPDYGDVKGRLLLYITLVMKPRCLRPWLTNDKFNVARISFPYVHGFKTSFVRFSSPKPDIDLSKFPVEYIRNFSIVAHVDHGKSTLADRLLEVTGTIPKTKDNKQVLDKLQVERERGITVKAQTASLFYEHKGQTYLLNLVDTPGHVDFNYEVSRSIAACQGVILLIDANSGVQAQTVANFYLAFESELTILPVMNKIDLKVAKPEAVLKQIKNVFDFDREEVIKVSAKFGTGIDELLTAVIEKIPPPTGNREKPLRALIFDSYYDHFRGAISNIALFDGVIRKGDKIVSLYTKKSYDVSDVGILHPHEKSTDVLYAGQVGFLVASMKNIKEAQVGDTICLKRSPTEPLPGFKAAKPMVYAGLYPTDQSQYPSLRSAISRLTLNDSSVTVDVDNSPALGAGFRLGFLGLLHMDVFNQRLEQEFDASVIVTAPNVPYKVKIHGVKNIKHYGGEELIVLNPNNLPNENIIRDFQEPLIRGTIILPDTYLADVSNLCLDHRGEPEEQVYIDDNRIMMKCVFPLNEVLIDFFDKLKAITSGFASFDYEEHGFRPSKIKKLIFLVNDREIEEMTMFVHESRARERGKEICARLQKAIPRQLVKIVVQAAIGKHIIAREEIQPVRKDVTAKCYGGDITRKQKLLRNQAEGKKKLRMFGSVRVPSDAFKNVLVRKQGDK